MNTGVRFGGSPLAREFWEKGKSDSCPIYDMHGHMGAWAAIYFPRPTPQQMIGTMDECGVRMLVFSHHLALNVPNLGNPQKWKFTRDMAKPRYCWPGALHPGFEVTARELPVPGRPR